MEEEEEASSKGRREKKGEDKRKKKSKVERASRGRGKEDRSVSMTTNDLFDQSRYRHCVENENTQQ